MHSIKSKAALIWVLILVAISVTVLVYLVKQDNPGTRPIIELGYFADEQDLVASINKNLAQKLSQNKSYWLGIEPEKPEHIDVISHLIKKIKIEHGVQNIIVDQELGLKSDRLTQLGATEIVSVKENLFALGEKLHAFEKAGLGYILVSAAIYTNTLLKNNPLHLLKEKSKLDPLTLSLAYLATDAEDEKNMLFQCQTEDRTGTADWGCTVVSKARFARKKIRPGNQKIWRGLLDSSGEKDFILILKKLRN